MWHSAKDYLAMLKSLLPLGAAWNRAPGSNLSKLLDACAQELARIDAEAWRALNEINPLSTIELMPQWEAVAGLPDECSPDRDLSLQERRQALLQKLRRPVGQNPAFYEAMASDYGYPEAYVEEFPIARVSISRIGHRLNSAPGGVVVDGQPDYYFGWSYVWLIHLGASAINYARVSLSTIGERLRSWGDTGMECRLKRAAPAHTIVFFAYNSNEEGELYATSNCSGQYCRPTNA